MAFLMTIVSQTVCGQPGISPESEWATLRQWPSHNQWLVFLGKTPQDSLMCSMVATAGNERFWGIRLRKSGPILTATARDPKDLAGKSLRFTVDGVFVGSYPITIRREREGMFLAASEISTSDLPFLERLFEIGGKVTFATDFDSATVSLEGADRALQDLGKCGLQLALFSTRAGIADKPLDPPTTAMPDSKSLENSLEQRRSLKSPTAATHSNSVPSIDGVEGSDGFKGADGTLLAAATRRAIGDRLRECWTGDNSELDVNEQFVRLTITTDTTGVIRTASISPNDPSRTGNEIRRAFAERARRAALDSRCAQLPLPSVEGTEPHIRGYVSTLTSVFQVSDVCLLLIDAPQRPTHEATQHGRI